jgi:hypothetical protein
LIGCHSFLAHILGISHRSFENQIQWFGPFLLFHSVFGADIWLIGFSCFVNFGIFVHLKFTQT